jgi:sensor c-di-GMP phosphodiesterase-like protein
MTILDDIRDGLERGELFVEYLPTMALADARCVGAEALIRWRRGEVIVPAGDFIPLLENTPLSGPLTYWVIDRVAAELGDWLGANADAHVSINVPPEILGRGGLAYAAKHSGLGARIEQIVLEITERGVPDRLGLEALSLMAQLGVRVALDDTMLSGANLALLTRCNFSMIKLSSELTAQIDGVGSMPQWLSGLESLLQNSSLQVVAEGVEAAYQARTLSAAGVQMAQGHLFSVPLSARALTDFYAKHRAGVGYGHAGPQ